MEHKILNKASELFITFGFKSVTMDDIANKLGISKKTIYKCFATKTELVEASSNQIFEFIANGIDDISENEDNPIEALYQIKKFAMAHLKDERSSPQYQLQKYYPELYRTLKQKQFDLVQNCLIKNLEKGIAQGLYRSNLNIQFISRLYFSGIIAIKDNDLFPIELFTQAYLTDAYLEYHLRGICTKAGLDYLNTITTTNQSNTDA